MTITYNISEAKKQLGHIGTQLKNGSKASILKNGKPFIYIIPAQDAESYEAFLFEQKKKKWEESLQSEEISHVFQKSIAEAKEELRNKPIQEFSSDELMKFLSE